MDQAMHALLDSLHAPYAPLLQAALAALSPASVTTALDLGCGAGHKSGWLAQQLRPGGQLIGLDIDRAALPAARSSAHYLAGDAAQLPLRRASIDLIWCVAALHTFANRPAALAEMCRVLRPGGSVLVSSVTQRWVLRRQWPPALMRACAGSLPRPADDPVADLVHELGCAGFRVTHRSALLLDAIDLSTATLPIADWHPLRAQVAPRLRADELAACDAVAAETPEPEPASLLLLAVAQPREATHSSRSMEALPD